MNNILKETKSKLQNICDRGFISTMRSGDTGPGYTLETLLGIEENNSSGADIGGQIELKAKRKGSKSRTTCFTLNPDWYDSAKNIVKRYISLSLKSNIINPSFFRSTF